MNNCDSISVKPCTAADYDALVEVWRRSVLASHHFLAKADFDEIEANLATAYFPAVELFGAVCDGRIVGFTGLSGDSIEMLFVRPEYQGRSVGSALIDFAIGRGCRRVDVNEQNDAALQFYRRRGFAAVSRDDTDDAGRSYPIIHCRLTDSTL